MGGDSPTTGFALEATRRQHHTPTRTASKHNRIRPRAPKGSQRFHSATALLPAHDRLPFDDHSGRTPWPRRARRSRRPRGTIPPKPTGSFRGQPADHFGGKYQARLVIGCTICHLLFASSLIDNNPIQDSSSSSHRASRTLWTGLSHQISYGSITACRTPRNGSQKYRHGFCAVMRASALTS